ncbi:MAG: nucleotidyltransferase family protein [Sphingobium sp.]
MRADDDIAVALIAAGRSARFGAEDKLLAPLGGWPLIQWAAAAGLTVETSRHYAITAEEARLPLPDRYRTLINPDREEGLAASLRIAARAAQEEGASALMILLADMPFVRPGHLSAMIAAYRSDSTRPVFSAPVTGGKPQPPVLFPAAFFPDLRDLSGDSGARALAAGATAMAVHSDDLFDVDTPDDLARAVAVAAEQRLQPASAAPLR